MRLSVILGPRASIALDNVLGWGCTQDLDCSVLPACREGSAAGSLHNVEYEMLKG